MRSYIDDIRHSALMEYWGRVGSVSCDGGLYDIGFGDEFHARLTIDEAFALMKGRLPKKGKRAARQFGRVKPPPPKW